MIDPALVLFLMLKAEPGAETSPWRASYPATAAAIAKAANAAPLFAGDDGAAKTAAVLVSVAWFESRFRPDAEGDHERKADGSKGPPRSFCAMQIRESNFRWLGITRESITQGPDAIDACIGAGLRVMRASFDACRAAPLEHRLDAYAGGGASCQNPPRNEGVHRVDKALRLFGALASTKAKVSR